MLSGTPLTVSRCISGPPPPSHAAGPTWEQLSEQSRIYIDQKQINRKQSESSVRGIKLFVQKILSVTHFKLHLCLLCLAIIDLKSTKLLTLADTIFIDNSQLAWHMLTGTATSKASSLTVSPYGGVIWLEWRHFSHVEIVFVISGNFTRLATLTEMLVTQVEKWGLCYCHCPLSFHIHQSLEVMKVVSRKIRTFQFWLNLFFNFITGWAAQKPAGLVQQCAFKPSVCF